MRRQWARSISGKPSSRGEEEALPAGAQGEASGVAVLPPEQVAPLDQEFRRGHGRDDPEGAAQVTDGGGVAQLARVREVALAQDAVDGAHEAHERGVGVPLGGDDGALEGRTLGGGQDGEDGGDRAPGLLDRLQEPADREPLDARHWTPSLSEPGPIHSSRSSIAGSTESARCAGIHVASSPSNDMATTTPASTSGSRGVA